MRIIQVVENLEVGGLERLALDLAIQQKSAGHVPMFYCAFDRGALADEAERHGIEVRHFNKKPGFSPGLIFRMAAAFRRDRPDVIHGHNPGVHHYAALAGWMAGVRAIVNTRHGPATSQGHRYQERYFRWVMPITGKVIFVSDDSRMFLVEHAGLPEAKSCVVLNGIPVGSFRAMPARPGSVRPRIRFGAVGRMVPVKGHSVLVEAFSMLLKKVPEAELRIVGGGSLFQELQNQVESSNLASRVRIEGLTGNIPDVLSELDVFVMSSTSEGLPVVILEAMAAGLPIVSTRVGGIPEVAPEGKVAWYCPPQNPEALMQAMFEAANSPRLEEMGAAAAAIAAERYDISAMALTYERIYTELLDRRHR